MLKEQKLALKMWKKVKSMVKHRKKAVDLNAWKIDFCERHGVEWMLTCWLCQVYLGECYKCKLYCMTAGDAPFLTVDDFLMHGRKHGYHKKDAVRACNKVLAKIRSVKR